MSDRHAQHSIKKELFSSLLWWGAFFVVLGGLIAYVAWDIFRPLAGTKIELLERGHVPTTEHPTYNSNPPTSGLHYVATEEWGFYERSLVKEKLVHNLEHGGILIYYNCEKLKEPRADACENLKNELKLLYEELVRRDKKIVILPNSEIEFTITLAAWGWLDNLDSVDRERTLKFFKDHINMGPERVLM